MQDFQFVAVNPVIGNDCDKTKLRSLVRANATKYQWRSKRPYRKTESAQATGRLREPIPVSDKFVSPENDYPDFSDDTIQDSRLLENSWPDQNGRPESIRLKCGNRITTSEQSVLLSLDSGGKVNSRLDVQNDPMFPPSLQPFPQDGIGLLMKYNVQIILPRLLPQLSNGQDSPAVVKWVQLAMTSRALFHTWVLGAEVHSRAAHGLPVSRDSIKVQSSFSQAIKYLNEEMRDPNRACKDENILAVIGMSTYGADVLTRVPAQFPLQGPLKALQGLDIYSKLKMVPMHAKGLAMLVKLRGGLSEIKMEGLAGIISYSGILMATRNLTKPPYPFVPLAPTSNGLLSINQSSQSLKSHGKGFSGYWQQPWSPIIHELLSVVEMMSCYTAMVRDHCEGKIFQSSLSDVSDYRNMVQHSLLSLPSKATDHNVLNANDEFYEACRLAAIIYSMLIIFPLSPSTAPFAAVASQLRVELLNAGSIGGTPESQSLLVWVLVMGGISAIGTSERPWFVSALARLTGRMNITRWEEMIDTLQAFLWLATTIDGDGISLWTEINCLSRIY